MAMESFEVVTDESKTRLPLVGKAMAWSDEITHRVNEFSILNKDGSLHQVKGQGARKFLFRCLLVDGAGDDSGEAYKQIEALLGAEPFGNMIHPRFGRVKVVFLSMKVSENLDEMTNGIVVEIAWSETGLREISEETPAAVAQEAALASSALVTLTQAQALALLALATAVDTAVTTFLLLVSDSTVSQYDMAVKLAALGDAVNLFTATAGVSVDRVALVAQAQLAYGRALAAYSLAGGQRPTIKEHTIEGQISLSRLCTRLYGGGGVAIESEIMRLNKIPDPLLLPTGARILILDPATVKL